MSNNVLRFLALLGLAAGTQAAYGQVGVGTATPNASAALDVASPGNNQGLLVPRLTAGQRTAIASPAKGLLVFQTDGPQQGFWYYDGAAWAFINPSGEGTTAGNGLSLSGSEVRLGGTLAGPTSIVQAGHSFSLEGGSVGIGLGNPTARLHVRTTEADNGISLGNTALGNGMSLKTNTNGPYLGLSNSSADPSVLTGYIQQRPASDASPNHLVYHNNSGSAHAFMATGAVRVGVGTTAPATSLHVAGSGSTVRLEGLAGTGTRMVTTDASGNLAPAAMPAGESTTASNGLSLSGSAVGLGGSLTQATTVAAGTQPLTITSGGSAGSETQDQLYNTATISGAHIGGGQWQSFTAGLTGGLTQVDVRLTNNSGAGQPLTLVMYEGTGTGGPELMRTGTTVFHGTNRAFVPFGLPAMLPLTAGQTYTIALHMGAGSTGNVAWHGNGGDGYAGGTSSNGGADFYFFTIVRPTTAVGPTLAVSDTRVGIGTSSPQQALHVVGTTRLQSLAGSGPRMVVADDNGDLSTQAVPTSADNLGNHTATQALSMAGHAINFGSTLGQQLNLWNTEYGLGVQPLTLLFRTGGGFAWYKNGAYAANQNDPGAGGTVQMLLSDAGHLGLGVSSAANRLDVQHAGRSGSHATDRALYVTGDFGEASNGAEFRHSNGTQGIGIGFNSLYATGSNADQHLNLMPRGTGNVGVGLTNPLTKLHIAGALMVDNGVIQRGGAPITSTTDLGLYSRQSGSWMRFVTNGGAIRFYSDDHMGTTPNFSIEASGNVAVGNVAATSALTVSGAVAMPYVTTGTATSFTLTNAHQTVRRFGSCGTINIPQASTCPGRTYTIINSAGTGSGVTLAVQTSGIIYDDVTSSPVSFLLQSERISIQSDGTNWIVIGR